MHVLLRVLAVSTLCIDLGLLGGDKHGYVKVVELPNATLCTLEAITSHIFACKQPGWLVA
jgi:hypothetical protein